MGSEDLPHHLGQSETLVFLSAKKRNAPKEEKSNNRREARPAKTTRRASHSFKCNSSGMKGG
jgi:hypothetical protein